MKPTLAIAPAPLDHHPLGPSNWPMWAVCPRYDGQHDDIDAAEAEILDAETGEPEKKEEATPDKKDAKGRGQLCHAALASIFTDDQATQDAAFAPLTQREEEQVRWVAEQCINIATLHGYQRHEIKVEQRLTMPKGDSFEDLYFGTGDIVIGPSIVCDAKFGDMRDYFPQMVGYLLALMERHGATKGHAYVLFGRSKRTVHYNATRETCETVGYAILRKRMDPNTPPTLCAYCGWCRHRATCSAVVGQVGAVVDRREDWTLKLPSLHVSKLGNDPVMAGVARWIWAAYLKPWGEGVEFITKGMVERGVVPLGFQKQAGRGKGKVGDVMAAIRAVEALGVPRETILEHMEPSVSALGRAYAAVHGCAEETGAKKVKAALGDIYREGEAYPKLVRAKDGEQTLRLALATYVQTLPGDLTQGEEKPTGKDAQE